MSKKADASGQPLTRRQLRELEAAKEAAKASQNSGTGAPVPAAPPIFSTPPTEQPATAPRPAQLPTPQPSSSGPTRISAAERIANGAGPSSEQARRAPASAVVPSNLRFAPDVFSAQNGLTTDTNVTRRSIHTAAKPVTATGAPEVPEVVPPTQTSAIRRIDETGEMSTVTASGQKVDGDVSTQNVARKSIWAQRTDETGVGQPASAEIPILTTPGPISDLGAEFSESERAEAAEQDTAMMMAIAADLASKEEQQTASFENQSTAAPVATPLGVLPVAPEVEENLPAWSAITATDSDLPTDALPGTGQILADAGITPISGDPALADAITDEEEPVLELDHSYTWLHYLIIVAIAAVLGMVVWQVGLNPATKKQEEPSPQSMAYSVTQML